MIVRRTVNAQRTRKYIVGSETLYLNNNKRCYNKKY